MKNLKILIVGLFLLFIHSGDLLGQGWEKYTPIPTNSTWTGMPMVDFTGDVTVAKTINGEYAIVPTLNTSDQFMLIDTNGNYSWNTFDTLPFQTDVHLVATNDNHYISVAEANTSFAPDLYLAKLDSIGFPCY
jgi:hypothetical protein